MSGQSQYIPPAFFVATQDRRTTSLARANEMIAARREAAWKEFMAELEKRLSEPYFPKHVNIRSLDQDQISGAIASLEANHYTATPTREHESFDHALKIEEKK